MLRPNVYSEKHQYEDGQLCLFNPKDGVTYGWNPSTDGGHGRRLGDPMVLRVLHLARDERLAGC